MLLIDLFQLIYFMWLTDVTSNKMIDTLAYSLHNQIKRAVWKILQTIECLEWLECLFCRVLNHPFIIWFKINFKKSVSKMHMNKKISSYDFATRINWTYKPNFKPLQEGKYNKHMFTKNVKNCNFLHKTLRNCMKHDWN